MLTRSDHRQHILICQRLPASRQRGYSFVDLIGGSKSDDCRMNLRMSQGKANRLARQALLWLQRRSQLCGSLAIALVQRKWKERRRQRVRTGRVTGERAARKDTN